MNFNQPISLVSRERINKQRTMIKPEDLKIGNYVRISSDRCTITKGTICKVIAIYAGRMPYNDKGIITLLPLDRSEEAPYSILCKDIEGIPFSIKFLTKNGFEETGHRMDRSGYEWCTYENTDSCVRVEYYPKTKDFSTFVGEEELCDITHVHELQNILSALKEDIEITV